MEDTPWGAEEVLMTSGIDLGEEFGELALRKVEIDRDEMTAYHFHRRRNELVYVQEGIIEVRMEDDYHELESGETHFIGSEETHQLQNIDDQVTELLEVAFPFDPEDVEMVEDPYKEIR